ncbi:Rho GTPase-activating protein 7 [Acipenser ruthenus]|uniref:Rho GTPase-activating protein 7 n=1 Tax=Acipenser ruthenus TaxID=7906 RepID=A0A662YTF7_ACIRT|nr:Rho GTPase-activating protein 7 [Acipenser ruthenus]
MPVANRKKSWEEHVTHRNGLQYSFDDLDIICCHGIVSDDLKSIMENNDLSKSGRRERCASLPECCHESLVVGFPFRQLGGNTKEVDENANHEGNEHFLSLVASTETMVQVPDDNSDLSSEENGHVETEQHVLAGTGPLDVIEPESKSNTETNDLAEVSANYSKLHQNSLFNEENKETVESGVEEGLEPCVTHFDQVNEESVQLKPNGLNVERTEEYSEELLQKASSTQHTETSEVVTTNDVIEPSAIMLAGCDGQHISDMGPVNCLFKSHTESIACFDGVSMVNAKEDEQDYETDSSHITNLTESLKTNDSQDSPNPCKPVECRVELRKGKEMREDRDRSRLDSMVLLIMKLEQLDQDIENALSATSSASNTPTQKRRHLHVGIFHQSFKIMHSFLCFKTAAAMTDTLMAME